MKNKRFIIFLFPIFLAMPLIAGLFGYSVVSNIPDGKISPKLTDIATEIDKSNESISKEKIEYIVALIKEEISKTQLHNSLFKYLTGIYKKLFKSILTVLIIQLVLAIIVFKYFRFEEVKKD
jgi:hypothetical protein